MTKEDWKYVEQQLHSQFAPVRLVCDGYNIQLRLQHITQFKNGIMVYVNEEFRAKWLFEECEERRRFLPVQFRSVYGPKDKKAYKRIRKSTLKGWGVDLDKKRAVYGFYWTSFASMKRHICENNSNIELIRGEES